MIDFFFNDTATTEIYTLSLHDALPIFLAQEEARHFNHNYIGTEHLLLGLLREDEGVAARALASLNVTLDEVRSEEHTSELQSRQYLVCRLLLEKNHKYMPISASSSHPT